MMEHSSTVVITSADRHQGVLDNVNRADAVPKDSKEKISGHQATHANLDEVKKKKSMSFHLSVLLLGVVGFLVALDANSLAVALPVSFL